MTDVADDAQGLIDSRRADALRQHYALRREQRLGDLKLLKRSPAGERICAGCSEPIELRRMAAMPDAVRCIECEKSQGRR